MVPNRESKSSGSENTYPEDLTELDTIRVEIAEMAGQAVRWLVKKSLFALLLLAFTADFLVQFPA